MVAILVLAFRAGVVIVTRYDRVVLAKYSVQLSIRMIIDARGESITYGQLVGGVSGCCVCLCARFSFASGGLLSQFLVANVV